MSRGSQSEQAREAERVSEESLKWGAATSLDVLQSTASLRQAELNHTTAAHGSGTEFFGHQAEKQCTDGQAYQAD